MEASRQQFYQQLLEKKEMLPDELMILRKRIESFNYYGDLKRVSEYFKVRWLAVVWLAVCCCGIQWCSVMGCGFYFVFIHIDVRKTYLIYI